VDTIIYLHHHNTLQILPFTTQTYLLSILIFTYRCKQENTGGLEVEAEWEHEVRLLPLNSLFSSFILFLFAKKSKWWGGAIYLSSTNLSAGEESIEVERLGRTNRKVFFLWVYIYFFCFFIQITIVIRNYIASKVKARHKSGTTRKRVCHCLGNVQTAVLRT
jgi:hypothetical protein